ncbi:hypothetical protein [Massilia sp. Leaf139]|uniref:hypothetical protein n=1 Tax=Massilia sp. Leaf139 TaxID=1736272 RepID=UPI0006F6410E|nr:hypothetical protein [Massilia sp. Leaf139]KQQ93667.1 hypothetical protein ASF77_22560 [Massilia sp. Leaf139]
MSGLALVIGLSMAGCGGGGGDAAPRFATVPELPALPPSGLVTAPGSTGPILFADAGPLRVLRHNAAWTYRGVEQRGDPAATRPEVYTNTVTMTESGGVFSEAVGNRYMDGLDGFGPLRFEDGRYTHTENIAINGNHVASGTFVELSSPVRQNEQFVAIDRKGIPLTDDFDGDGTKDKVNIAAWTRVIGKEMFDLPNRRGVETVRVDLTIRVQIVLSRGNVVAPIEEGVKSFWYAPGLGIVKRRIDRTAENPQLPRRVVTETLESFDGVSTGLGYLPMAKTAIPPELAATAPGLHRPVAAVGFGTHAVVAVHLPDQRPPNGITLAQLDNRGKVLALRKYELSELFPGATAFDELRLLRVGEELRLVARTGWSAVSMLAFDGNGQRILRTPVLLQSDGSMIRDLEGNSYRLAQGGDRLWLNWIREGSAGNGLYQRAMMLRSFDSAGAPLGAERMVRSATGRLIDDAAMVFADNRLALSWREDGLLGERRLALVDAASGALTERALDLKGGDCAGVGLVALQPGLALSCRESMPAPLRVARLDAGGDLVLAGASLSGEALQAPWLTKVGEGSRVFGGGGAGELTVLANQYGQLWPEDSGTAFFATVLRTRSLDGRPAGREPQLLARMPALDGTVLDAVPLGNRLLLIGSDVFGSLQTALVWLPE